MPSGLWHLDMDPRAGKPPSCIAFWNLPFADLELMISIPMVDNSVSRLEACVAIVDRHRLVLVVEQVRKPNKSQLLLVQYLRHLIDKHTAGQQFLCPYSVLLYVLC